MDVAIVVVLLYMNVVYAQGNPCKTMNFMTAMKDKALVNHTIKTESVSNEGQCKIKCYTNDHCISYNFVTSAINGQNTCELSDSDHVAYPNDIQDRSNAIYRSAENNCQCVNQKACRVNFADDTHDCQCKTPGFTGPNCDQDIDECVSSPCSNGGTCQDMVNGYTCTCPGGFTGINCQTAISGPCDSTPCLNEGTCQVQGSGYTCTCTAQTSGDNCQVKVCQSGWISTQGNCYKIDASYKEWSTAKDKCKSLGGHLISIHSQAENTAVAKLIGMDFWIGLNDRETDGTFKWIDGTPFDYNGITKSENGNGCFRMEYTTESWKETPCTGNYKPFVCKY